MVQRLSPTTTGQPATTMTDTKTLNRDTSVDPTTDKPAEPKRLLDLSATQLVGGALAAMTSAVIGARLGVAGTILGAAIGSIVAGVAGSLYTASLTHTRARLTSAFVGRVGDTRVEVATVSDDTTERDGWHWDTEATTVRPSAAVAPPSPDPVAAEAVLDVAGTPARRLPWRAILVSTAAVFFIALAGITGFELVSGQAVSGGEGTTLTQVSEGRSGGSDTAPSQAPSVTPSTDASTDPSSTPSVSSEPSSSATTEPSSTPGASTDPSGEPSQSSDPSASAQPSTRGTPSTPDQGAAANAADGGAGAGG
jgi:hypothetical protein